MRREGPGTGAADGGLDALEAALGHRFERRALLERALSHRSWAFERGTAGEDSESLEFLGDAVLSLGVSRMLFDRLSNVVVGDLARSRAYLVSEANLARKARRLDLGRHLRLGRGEEKGGGRSKDSLLADAYEAVLAAVYLDGGLEAALSFVERHFASQIARIRGGSRAARDFKTDLQEALQAMGMPVPRYRVAGESGPDHRKSFRVELLIADRVVAAGSGPSKKSAEQRAARRALRDLERIKEGRGSEPPAREGPSPGS